MNLNGKEYFYIRNVQNDVIGLHDSEGKVVVNYSYDTWGNIVSITGSLKDSVGVKNPYRYRGYRYDEETGLYYLQSRYYNAEWGRFINCDDIGGKIGELGTHNAFKYCFNNPVNMSDESGQWPKWMKSKTFKKIAIGVAVISEAAVVTVATGGAAAGTLLAAVHCVASGALVGAIVGATTGAVIGAATRVVSNRVTTGSWKGSRKAAISGAADGFMEGAITGAITGGVTSNACFIAGTVISTQLGKKAIEDVKVGDMVYSENPETGEKGLKRVVQTFENETDELVHIKVNGEEIVTTPEHPFYVPRQGWTEAIKLRAGDILVLVNGKEVVVEKVQHEILETPIKVYNFEVEDYHTYYVSNSGVLVHNMCSKRSNSKIEKMGKIKGNTPRNNQAQNKQFQAVVKEFKLSKKEQRLLHDNITGKGYSYSELREEAIYLFPRLDKE